jgi:hypothetical protein
VETESADLGPLAEAANQIKGENRFGRVEVVWIEFTCFLRMIQMIVYSRVSIVVYLSSILLLDLYGHVKTSKFIVQLRKPFLT